MADSQIYVSGYDASYAVDTITFGDQQRQVIVLADGTTSGNYLSIGASGGALVEVLPASGAYLSHAFIDADANGDNPQTDTQLIAAPGSGKRLVIYGYQIASICTAAGSNGIWRLTDGDYSSATNVLAGGFMLGEEGVNSSEISFQYGLPLTANTKLVYTVLEASTQVYVRGTVYYRIEPVG